MDSTLRAEHAPIGIRIKSLSKRFADDRILEDIDLAIQPGEFSVIVGPSGCGKTTLLRMIGGLEDISGGHIQFLAGSTELTKLPLGLVGYCFQEPRLIPWRTVLENVALPLELAAVDRKMRMERAESTLTSVGLLEHRHKLPHQLSGGMQMRVSIARSMVTRPRLLLLDEPFVALDEISRARLDDELLSVWKEAGITIVLVTHSLVEAVYLGQTVHIMSGAPGQIADSLTIDLPDRIPELRSTPEFAQWVALAHGILATDAIGAPL